MRCTTMLDLLASMLERAVRSVENQIIVYLRSIFLFAVAKDVGKMRHHKKILQGPVVMLVSSLVSVRRKYGLCKRSY
jgi:hypothetical protein